MVQISAVVKRLTVRYPTAHGGFRFQLDGFVFPFFLFFYFFLFIFFNIFFLIFFFFRFFVSIYAPPPGTMPGNVSQLSYLCVDSPLWN